MANNVMVTYVGAKKHIYVPFTHDNTFPVMANCDIVDTVRFERGQMVELPPERAEALLAQSPDVFKVSGSIKPQVTTIRKGEAVKPPQLVKLSDAEKAEVAAEGPGGIMGLIDLPEA